jgi:hypothetical protein
VYQHDGNHAYPIETSTPTTTPMSTKQDAYTDYDEAHRPMRPPPTILGLRKRNFWVLVGFAVVVVAAAVGGSVGGSMAVRNTGCVAHTARGDATVADFGTGTRRPKLRHSLPPQHQLAVLHPHLEQHPPPHLQPQRQPPHPFPPFPKRPSRN